MRAIRALPFLLMSSCVFGTPKHKLPALKMATDPSESEPYHTPPRKETTTPADSPNAIGTTTLSESAWDALLDREIEAELEDGTLARGTLISHDDESVSIATSTGRIVVQKKSHIGRVELRQQKDAQNSAQSQKSDEQSVVSPDSTHQLSNAERRLLEGGITRFADRDFKTAEYDFIKLTKATSWPGATFNLAVAAEARGHLQLSVDAYRSYLLYHPDDVIAEDRLKVVTERLRRARIGMIVGAPLGGVFALAGTAMVITAGTYGGTGSYSGYTEPPFPGAENDRFCDMEGGTYHCVHPTGLMQGGATLIAVGVSAAVFSTIYLLRLKYGPIFGVSRRAATLNITTRF